MIIVLTIIHLSIKFDVRHGVSLLNNSNEAVCSAAVVSAAVQFRSLRHVVICICENM